MNSTIFMIIGFTLLILYMAIVSIRYLKNSKREKVKCNRRSKIFRRRMNKDVKRVMDALDSPNTVIAYTGPLYKDNISFTCKINKDDKEND